MIDIKYLHECFEYSPDIGELKWKIRPRNHFVSSRGFTIFNSRFANKVIKGHSKEGYIRVKLDGKLYKAHIIIWAMQTGKWPEKHIDHWDRNESNNKWDNLREATVAQNGANRGKQKNNTSGYKGVSYMKDRDKWNAQISVNNKKISLGRFETKEEAYESYCKAALKYHGEFASF